MFFVFHRLDQNSGRKNFLGWGTVIIFVFLNLFSVNYQVAQANASERMAQWLIKHEMIQETHQGSIASHSGNYFMPFYQLPKTHRVTQTPDSQEPPLHQEDVMVLGFKVRTYYLVKN